MMYVFAGFIFDVTNSYATSFIASGGLIAAGGLLCMPIRKIAQWEERRMNGMTATSMDIENMGSAYLPVPDADEADSIPKDKPARVGLRFADTVASEKLENDMPPSDTECQERTPFITEPDDAVPPTPTW